MIFSILSLPSKVKYSFCITLLSLILSANLLYAQRAVKGKIPVVNLDFSHWQGDLFSTVKGYHTLKDIVLPGSHDAGMSVLTATGGSQKGTINQCNTLTQTLNIARQLQSGIRMFDLRVGVLKDTLYLKHSSSDCMEDAIGGGYGEMLEPVLLATKAFLEKNKTEFLIFSLSHFCPKEIAVAKLAEKMTALLGKEHVYLPGRKRIGDIKIEELRGKVLLAFETPQFEAPGIMFNTMVSGSSDASLNFQRAYAATNNLKKLILVQASFFTALKSQQNANDLIRVDWQLTQSPQEAAMVCNAFESDQNSPLFDGAIFLTNVLSKHKSIITHARRANKVFKDQVNKWIADETINSKNKPNILYVDDAGSWITQYCMELNMSALYNK
ncbi:hypothetical protein [Pedobacter cryoconitis]|uniref:Phosphatidylinositol diacylglycerol-lyase n=1 Tax=Pedobacter cryoconitis TaxID=188932 RepID=A0A7X0MGZ4_9SPHI|nr:hypothetical protein [Pedobacter cryoconitis]MBB6498589.1 hypothetical protein [Pedobacter cryoconitis]